MYLELCDCADLRRNSVTAGANANFQRRLRLRGFTGLPLSYAPTPIRLNTFCLYADTFPPLPPLAPACRNNHPDDDQAGHHESECPALTPKVLSIVSKSTRKSAPPHNPGTLALPPLTEVPPITTTAIDASRYSSPISKRRSSKIACQKRSTNPAKCPTENVGCESNSFHGNSSKPRGASILANGQDRASINCPVQDHPDPNGEDGRPDRQERYTGDLRRK